jgi:hypothetical protein
MDASQKHQKMHGRSRNTGIFQYFDTLGNPLKNRRFNVSQGRRNRMTHGATGHPRGLGFKRVAR